MYYIWESIRVLSLCNVSSVVGNVLVTVASLIHNVFSLTSPPVDSLCHCLCHHLS